MIKLKQWIDKVIEWICVLIVGIMTMLVSWQVITRYVFNNPSAISEQLAKYLFVWLVMIGAAYVFGKRDHMAIVFVKDKMPFRIRLTLEVIAEVIVAGFALAVLLFGGYRAILMTRTQMDPSLNIPVAYIYSVIFLSGILTVFYSITNIWEIIKAFHRNEIA